MNTILYAAVATPVERMEGCGEAGMAGLRDAPSLEPRSRGDATLTTKPPAWLTGLPLLSASSPLSESVCFVPRGGE
ncbi:hypothetical protein E2C01_100535 [Portunus trituberculatus]|uniref:Uncharacterized protein n=1 Tax=Portunus trituberculatus TaxID=210409 RepID=A0A5B7KDJ3_PORTR|nr:hypothetical protein [Portunus trituberculatus]